MEEIIPLTVQTATEKRKQCLSPLIPPPIALLTGLIIAQFTGHPYLHLNHKATHILLQVSVTGLGFCMHVDHALSFDLLAIITLIR